jgi:predicted TIM-barrel fold metal-dependent hydrolase
MIIDSLTHITADGKWFHTPHDASEQRLLKVMDEAGVDKAIVVALAGYIDNDFVLAASNQHSDRFIPCASFNPAAYATPEAARESFISEFASSPFPLLKLHPRLNGYDLLDPRVLTVLKVAAEMKYFRGIYLDTFLRCPGVESKKSVVDTLFDIACRFPQLRFVFLHGAGSQLLHLYESIRTCENVLLDVSFTLQHYSDSSILQDVYFLMRHFDRRLLVGSDFPEYTPDDTLTILDKVLKELPVEKKENIFGGNLVSLLKEKQ